MNTRTFALATCLTVLAAASQAEPIAGLDPTTVKQADPAIVELGNMLFFDPRLSGDASTACSDCHDPNYGWSDGSELARGYPGTMHWRNSQTVMNMGFMTGGFHWDAGLGSLADQVHDALGASFVANISETMVEERLRQIPEYIRRIDAIWSEGPIMDHVAESIAAYQRSLISVDSPFDMYMAGESAAMSPAALRGMELFNGKANCSSCHNGALISDMQFHNTSIPPNPELAAEPLRQVTFRYLMRVKGLEPSVYESLDRDPGRYLATLDPDDLGRFRTPPLRYLAYTAPYMHNGIFYTLDEVVEFYNIGGTEDVFGTKSSLIKPLGLSPVEKDDLVAFLESLSGSEVKAGVPDLPEYEDLAFPQIPTLVTAASLKASGNRVAVATKDATAPVPAAVATDSTGGLVFVPKGDTAPMPASLPIAASGKVVILGGERFVMVERGDTLGFLADLVYGDATAHSKIFDANRDRLKQPDALVAGMLLRAPN